MARVSPSLLAAGIAAVLVVTVAPAYATTPPTPVSGVTARPGDSQVTLRWTNPADPDFAGVTVVHKPGEVPPATPDDGTVASVAAPAVSVVVKALTNNTAYSFSVFSRNTGGEFSTPVTLTRTPLPAVLTKVTISVSPRIVTFGGRPVVTAKLVRSDTGAAVAGESISLFRKVAGADTFARATRLTTNSAGVVTRVTAPEKNTHWYAVHDATPYFAGSKSTTVTSYVRPKMVITRTPTVVEQNQSSIVKVVVYPAHAGHKVALQRYYDGAWHPYASKYLDSASAATFAVATSVIGTRYFRIVMSADSDHLGAKTATVSITTIRRTIRSGMTGSDVYKVEQRLRALHYDPGTVDSYFNYDSVHATMAFQKVNRLPVTGAVDRTTYAKLWSPVVPRLRYARTGNWVEADLTRQVLYYVKSGAIWRILDISSGSGETFYVDGETHQAITPTGSFTIFHRIDGMRVSRLGELWRPAYFAQGGYAIHGSGFVPAWPDSHGCIRITNPAMNRLFPMLTIGLPVYVYRS